jgi:hypothetical protein
MAEPLLGHLPNINKFILVKQQRYGSEVRQQGTGTHDRESS